MDFVSAFVGRIFAYPGVEQSAMALIIDGIWPFFNVLAMLTIVGLVIMGPRLGALLREVPNAVWRDVSVLTLLGLILRLCLSPRCPQVYFDEVCYGELAQTLRTCGRYCVMLQFPDREQIMPFLPAWPFVLAWLGKIIELNWAKESLFCIFMASTAVPLSYAFAWKLRSERLFCCALALLVALWPLHLRISACAALENGSFIVFLMLGLFLMIWAEREESCWLWSAGCVWVWFANWRMENPFVLAVSLLISLSIADTRLLQLWRKPIFYGISSVAVCLAWPGLLCDLFGIFKSFYLTDGTSVQKMTVLHDKMLANCVFWVSDEFHPLFYSLLALIGLALLRRYRCSWAWACWFLLLNVFYGFIPTADFSLRYTCDSWRNSLFPTWGLLILAALAIAEMGRYAHKKKALTWILLGACALGVAGQPWDKYRYIVMDNTWIREFRLAERVGARLPAESRMFISGASRRIPGDGLYLKMWNLASNHECQWYVLPEEAIVEQGQKSCPVLLEATQKWCKDGIRTFLCVVSQREDSWDLHRCRWFAKYYRLRLVAGEADPYIGESFDVYEIDSLSPLGEAWVLQSGEVR